MHAVKSNVCRMAGAGGGGGGGVNKQKESTFTV